jgi:hypothetical protein
MSTNAFAGFVRQATAGVSRRASLQILGGAPLAAALMGSSIVGAKKSGKKGKQRKRIKKKAQQKSQQQCLAQVEQCESYWTVLCAELDDFEKCVGLFSPCCQSFGTCNFNGFFDCFLEGQREYLG